jgi:hypothetical protein
MPGDWSILKDGQEHKSLLFLTPYDPVGLRLIDFQDMCKLAETNAAMKEALEHAKFIWELSRK